MNCLVKSAALVAEPAVSDSNVLAQSCLEAGDAAAAGEAAAIAEGNGDEADGIWLVLMIGLMLLGCCWNCWDVAGDPLFMLGDGACC